MMAGPGGKIMEKLQDQVWFQQLKVKWDELDVRAKTGAKYLGLAAGIALIVIPVGTMYLSVADKKDEIDRKAALVEKIRSSQDELRRLREVTSRFGGSEAEPWGMFLQSRASMAGFAPANITVGSETVVASAKAAPKGKNAPKGASDSDAPEETIVELGLKKINIRQLVKYVHEVENGGRTVKVRRLQIDTAPDESGYLDANLIVSAFRMKQ